jgi:hypothetical protein
MLKRPIVIENGMLYLRYGIMNESTINIETIAFVALSIKDLEQNNRTRKLSFFGDLEGHNVLITLKKENSLIGLYGIKKNYKALALHVDDKQGFKATLDEMLRSDVLS